MGYADKQALITFFNLFYMTLSANEIKLYIEIFNSKYIKILFDSYNIIKMKKK